MKALSLKNSSSALLEFWMECGMSEETEPKSVYSLLRIISLATLWMAFYAWAKLSRTSSISPALLLAVYVLIGTARLVLNFREATKLEFCCETVHVLAMMSFVYGAFHESAPFTWAFIYATIFYLPSHTLHCNRKLAFVIGLLILCIVASLTLNLVVDPQARNYMSGAYAVLVTLLWMFCSKLSARVFGLDEMESSLRY